ncbi:hypothetical protein MsAc7_15010 [Methanolapillus millepedarum]|uniref:Uncharacterized protein n=1 Tax=Methanolapillus millepedarum TaxID=3028296 RepID=A0AA96V3M9_9EURY|nr:hypothetical protein MsAc7_15010 [Methanosarcinaceae archaeon Ac7]
MSTIDILNIGIFLVAFILIAYLLLDAYRVSIKSKPKKE